MLPVPIAVCNFFFFNQLIKMAIYSFYKVEQVELLVRVKLTQYSERKQFALNLQT